MANDFDLGLARDFGTALLLGALIGIDREQHNLQQGGIGLRSFVLLALVGATAGYLGQAQGLPWLLPTTLFTVVAVVVAAYVAGMRQRPERPGITTELAAIAICLIGALVTTGHLGLGVGLGVTTAALLAYKEPMHALVGKLDRGDVLAAMRFLLATFLVLPLLPDRTIDPWHVINPHSLWLLVLLISGLSLVGYVASRWFGPRRGIVLTGITGGLVSSTAVTLAFARQSGEENAQRRQLAAGVLLAWVVMSVRVVVAAAFVYPALLTRLWLPCLVMALLGAGFAVLYLRRGPEGGAEVRTDVLLKNPFSLWSATKFGLLFAAVQLLLVLAQEYLPASGSYTIAVLAGVTDVDAITLSMAERASAAPAMSDLAVVAIMLASFSNTITKVAITMFLGRRMTGYVLPAGLSMVAGGAAALWLF